MYGIEYSAQLYIYDLHHHRITTWNHAILNPVALQYADLSLNEALPSTTVLDLWMEQSVQYANRERIKGWYTMGTKRVHALKFQAVALQNGLIGRLFGPVGKNADLCKNLS